MRVWAIANQKGGVGKTTSTITLGGLLAQRGRRVLMLDLDPHASMTSYFGIEPEQPPQGVFDLFVDYKQTTRAMVLDTALPTATPNLSFIPGQIALATMEKQLSTQDGAGLIVTRLLSLVDGDFDDVLLDCPPILGMLMVNALAACDVLVVPVQTEFLALHGLERMVRTIDMVSRSRKAPLPYVIVPTLFDKRTRASTECLKTVRETYGDRVWSHVIPVDTRLRDASYAHQAPSAFDAHSRAVEAYRLLLADLEQIEVMAGSHRGEV